MEKLCFQCARFPVDCVDWQIFLGNQKYRKYVPKNAGCAPEIWFEIITGVAQKIYVARKAVFALEFVSKNAGFASKICRKNAGCPPKIWFEKITGVVWKIYVARKALFAWTLLVVRAIHKTQRRPFKPLQIIYSWRKVTI